MPSIEPALPAEIATTDSEISIAFRIEDVDASSRLDLVVWVPNPTGHGWVGPPAGIWRYADIPVECELDLDFQLAPFDEASVSLRSGESAISDPDAIVRSDYRCWPRQSLGIALIADQGSVLGLHRIDIVSSSESVLGTHYARAGHQDAYIPVEDHFGEAFHAARIRQARRLVTKFAQTGPVLDAGSGYSLLRMAAPDTGWPFQLVCCDWDQAAMSRMACENPGGLWVSGAANNLPFLDESFSLVYVGEVIEHLTDPMAGLDEWSRVLKPGGHLILTTPNRRHRLNRLHQTEAPENLEHLHEFTPGELASEIASASLDVVHLEGLYYAAAAYRMPGGQWTDPLRSNAGFRGKGRALRLCMELGRKLPEHAYNICAVARKR